MGGKARDGSFLARGLCSKTALVAHPMRPGRARQRSEPPGKNVLERIVPVCTVVRRPPEPSLHWLLGVVPGRSSSRPVRSTRRRVLSPPASEPATRATPSLVVVPPDIVLTSLFTREAPQSHAQPLTVTARSGFDVLDVLDGNGQTRLQQQPTGDLGAGTLVADCLRMASHRIGLALLGSRSVTSLGLLACCSILAACELPVSEVEGGANTNDRSDGGNDGAELLTGSMVLSPPPTSTAEGEVLSASGSYGLMQRNTVSVFVDFEAEKARELDYMVDRWVFSPVDPVGYAVVDGDLVAFALPVLEESWRTAATPGSIDFLRVSTDGRTLVVADGFQGSIVDASTGVVRASFAVGDPEDVAFLPDGQHALLVGQTTWLDHVPSTPVVRVDLFTGETLATQVPNCAAPIVVLPTGDRALLSPTFCTEGVSSTGNTPWTNPDPVSIIDLSSDGPHFLKNLPGFGPVALSEDGTRAVAYLDLERLDPTMFDDPAQIPHASGPRYYVMVIDPASLGFSLTPIGDALPRFVLARDNSSLLVDASVQVRRSELRANAELTFDENGLSGKLEVTVFNQNSPFGRFDLDQLEFEPFSGPAASLDRFVMPRDGRNVYTLKRTPDGLGGDLYQIDLETGTTQALDRSLRDIGLLPDGQTLVLRIRSSPLTVDGGIRLQEEYCLSLDGVTCETSIHFTSNLVFWNDYCSNPANYHDC